MKKCKKKKILFVIPSLISGGSQRVLIHIANHISRDKYIPQLLLIFNDNHTYLTYLRNDVEVVCLNISPKVKYHFLPALFGILRQKPAIVFMGLSGINVMLSVFVPFFKKIRWIARETNTLSLHVSNKRMLFLYRNFYKNYQTIIAQGKDMKEDLVKNFDIPAKKVEIINNPIDTEFIDKKLKEDVLVQLPDNRINLLACGRLTHQKGFDLLISAFSALTEKEKYHLTIVGGGENAAYKEFLFMEVKKHKLEKQITFTGYNVNVYKWFEKADVFVLSSRYEGFPNVVLEALYCGTPVLANNCKGGISEIINEGYNGFIFDFVENNFERKLIQILESNLNAKEIAQNTKSRFNLKDIINQYEDIIDA